MDAFIMWKSDTDNERILYNILFVHTCQLIALLWKSNIILINWNKNRFPYYRISEFYWII